MLAVLLGTTPLASAQVVPEVLTGEGSVHRSGRDARKGPNALQQPSPTALQPAAADVLGTHVATAESPGRQALEAVRALDQVIRKDVQQLVKNATESTSGQAPPTVQTLEPGIQAVVQQVVQQAMPSATLDEQNNVEQREMDIIQSDRRCSCLSRDIYDGMHSPRRNLMDQACSAHLRPRASALVIVPTCQQRYRACANPARLPHDRRATTCMPK